MTDQLKDFEVTEARFIGGQHCKVGQLVQMTDRVAKYYIEPHGTGLRVPGARKEVVGGLDDPNVKNPTAHATGKSGK